MSDLINRQDVLKLIRTLPSEEGMTKGLLEMSVKQLPSAEPNILDDGTLTITVPHGILSKVNRVIVDEVGTKFCKMMYQDALPTAEQEHEYTMEEFMFGQDMGNPEDGSL